MLVLLLLATAADGPTTPDPGMEVCYECRGQRTCWSCNGQGRTNTGSLCLTCGGGRVCAVCSGTGQLPLGTDAATD